MREAGMDVLVNPFGTLYNPASIALAVSRLDSDDSYTEADCVQMGAGAGLVCSFEHHTSFARSSEQRRRRTEIDQECELINEGIARRHADKDNKTGLIIMNQIVKIDSGEDGNDVEIAVCDMIYARKTDTRHVTIVYKPGIKTCRLTIEGNINELLHSCFGNHHQVMRCHKDYIVNTDRITHVQSLGCDCYELKLRGTKHAIPVSDKYRQLIYDTLTAK